MFACKSILAVLALGALASASDVVELTDTNFDEVVKDGKSGAFFVEFFAPWCGHCKQLTPTWEELAKDMKDIDEGSTIAKVDCIANKAVCDRFGVKGFPTLKTISEGKVYDYSGGRSKGALSDEALGGFVSEEEDKGKPLPAPKKPEEKVEDPGAEDVVVLNNANFHDTVRNGKATFIKFYAPWCGHCKRLIPTWNKLAKDISAVTDKVQIAKLDATAELLVAEQIRPLGLRGYPTLMAVQGEKVFKYEGERTISALKEFAVSLGSPLTAESIGDLPSAPSPLTIQISKGKEFLNENFNGLGEDIEHIYNFRKNALGLAILVGFLVGVFFARCCCGGRSGKDKKD